MTASVEDARTVLRDRVRYAALAVATMLVGLVVHLVGGSPKPAWRDVLGDALWAVMMLWLIGVLAPRARPATRAAAALGVCVTVELSQLVHTSTLDALRSTTLGHLVLGSGFDPRDLAAYAAGVLAAALLDRMALRHRRAS